MPEQAKLTIGTSLYLDFVRFAAASMVVLAHFSPFPPDSVAKAALHGRGDQAVAIFFVLSGFVIAYVIDEREKSGVAYAISRLSRLYSVALPALALTLAFDAAGSLLSPSTYAHSGIDRPNMGASGYLLSLLFINEWKVLGPIAFQPGSNLPYWSLSFEATYYLITGLVLFAPRWLGILGGLLTLLAAGPTIAVLYPLWLLGFALFRYRHLVARFEFPLALLAISIILILIIPVLPLARSTPFPPGLFLWNGKPADRLIVADYLSGIGFALQLLAILAITGRRRGKALPSKLERVVRSLGSVTFPLYAIHYPALLFLSAVAPFGSSSAAYRAFVLLGVYASAALLTVAADQLRDRTRSLAAALLQRRAGLAAGC